MHTHACPSVSAAQTPIRPNPATSPMPLLRRCDDRPKYEQARSKQNRILHSLHPPSSFWGVLPAGFLLLTIYLQSMNGVPSLSKTGLLVVRLCLIAKNGISQSCLECVCCAASWLVTLEDSVMYKGWWCREPKRKIESLQERNNNNQRTSRIFFDFGTKCNEFGWQSGAMERIRGIANV